MKKILALFISFIFLFSTVYAKSADVSIYDKVNWCIKIGFLKGDTDGNLRLDDNVSRAEMAVFMSRALGMSDAAKGVRSENIFSDVEKDHWASGNISIMKGMGVINGYPDGTFKPDDNVKVEDVVKMFVAATGYEKAAKELGGYPQGYITLAKNSNLINNENFKMGDYAKRQFVIEFFYDFDKIGYKLSIPHNTIETKYKLEVGDISERANEFVFRNSIDNELYVLNDTTKVYINKQSSQKESVKNGMVANEFFFEKKEGENVLVSIYFLEK